MTSQLTATSPSEAPAPTGRLECADRGGCGGRLDVDPAALARSALSRGRHPVARLVSLFEDARPGAALRCDEALAVLAADAAGRGHRSRVIGITGTPGSGKSSLLSKLTTAMLAASPELTVAVVAVDPSSPNSGGALLGDRTRMDLDPAEHRVFFRSQASATALGGLAPATYSVCRALSLIYDAVIVETVGIGQSEADIRHLADRVYLVMAPLGGDEIQYLKAGIIEIPDAFVVNKWDEKAAARTYHQLRGSLWLARPEDPADLPVHRTSAKTGFGVAELAAAVLADIAGGARPDPASARAPHFFATWVSDEWGRVGRRHLDALGGATKVLASGSGFAEAQRNFDAWMRTHIAKGLATLKSGEAI